MLGTCSLAPDVSPMLGVLQFKLRKHKHRTNVWCETEVESLNSRVGVCNQTTLPVLSHGVKIQSQIFSGLAPNDSPYFPYAY